MALHPTSRLVATGWLQLAVPDARVGDRLPAADEALRTVGFVRVPVVGGSGNRDVPMRAPVVTAECWVAPGLPSMWDRAEQLAERVWAATFDPSLMGVTVDLAALTGAAYTPARMHTVLALNDPGERVPDPNDWARVDVDLQVNWSAA